MTYSKYRTPVRTTPRRIRRILAAGLLVVIAATAAALGYLPSEHHGALGKALPGTVATSASSPERRKAAEKRGARKERKRRESAENITRGRCAGPRGDAKPLISCLIRGH